MTTIQRVLSIPFSLLRIFSREKEVRAKEQRKISPLRPPSEQPEVSRRFRLERECARYRSIHFPR